MTDVLYIYIYELEFQTKTVHFFAHISVLYVIYCTLFNASDWLKVMDQK